MLAPVICVRPCGPVYKLLFHVYFYRGFLNVGRMGMGGWVGSWGSVTVVTAWDVGGF